MKDHGWLGWVGCEDVGGYSRWAVREDDQTEYIVNGFLASQVPQDLCYMRSDSDSDSDDDKTNRIPNLQIAQSQPHPIYLPADKRVSTAR
jgi:hypothetical protein